jgi:hypothetical protein
VGNITDKVVNVSRFGGFFLIFLENKGFRPAEAIMKLSDGFRIAESEAFIFTGEFIGELIKIL